MTGIDFGFGDLLAYSVICLLFVPLVTIIFINQINKFEKLESLTKYILNSIFFICFGYFTLLIIRNFHATSFKFLLSYIIIVTLLIFIIKRVYKASR